MNILIDRLPITINIDDIDYKINSDFRTSILFELLMQDYSIDDEDKIYTALGLYYPNIPHDLNKAIEKMLWFYSCGKEDSSNNEVKICDSSKQDDRFDSNTYSHEYEKQSQSNKIYCFDFDSEYIYAAFLDQYNIDLQDINYMHWWKFKALFKSLKEDNEIVKIMGYRSIKINDNMSKEEKEYYKKMKKLHEIPLSKEEQEFINQENKKINDLENALLKGEDISNLI